MPQRSDMRPSVGPPRDVAVGSKGEILSPSTCFPLHLRQRTCGGCTAMTVSCHNPTPALQNKNEATFAYLQEQSLRLSTFQVKGAFCSYGGARRQDEYHARS